MRLTAFILLVFGLHVSAKTSSQTVTLSGKHLTLEAVFAAVEKQTGYIALFDGDAIKDAKLVTVNVVNQSLERFLFEVFKDQPLHFTIKNTSIFVTQKNKRQDEITTLWPQLLEDSVPKVKITGTVIDSNGQLLAGATIRVKGKNKAITNNNQGTFELSVEPGSTLIVSYAGYVTVEQKLQFSHNIVVKMEPNALLEEAVIYNGYQKIQQKYLTGAVTSLKMDSIMQPGLSTIDKMLEGRVPGLTFMQNSGQAGAAPKLRIRGTNTYLGSREPLWVVDGIIRTNPIPIDPARINDPDFVNLLGNAISGLNPFDIEQVDVLKDATAAALYGVRAANGVIVITTKRGKPGPPTVNYNLTNTFTTRPRYSDRSMFMMNSRDRVDLSREMIEKKIHLNGTVIEAYEKAIIDYYGGLIDFDTFRELVGKSETVNTDWLGNTMRDVFATKHTLSVSGGNNTTSYRASVGYRTEPGVIKKEKNDLYTGLLNMQMNYKKFKVDFNIQLSKDKRNYTPAEIGLMNYAYGTSRAIPLYNEDGSLYYYPTVGSYGLYPASTGLKTMNILNEMDQTGETVESNEYTASVDLSYEIARGLQFNTRLAYTGGDSYNSTWFTEDSEWATKLRQYAYQAYYDRFLPDTDPMPFGGEYRQQFIRRKNYIINGRLNYSRFIDKNDKHQLIVELATDVMSNRYNSFQAINRGYYPNRGQSFAQIDLAKYPDYRVWLESNPSKISMQLQNSLRPYLTGTYIFNERYVVTATASQEFSNSFGSRSNEKFFPTWALSGRWNLHEDLLRNVSWVDRMALLLSFGTRGNMLSGQTPYTIISKEAINQNYDAFSSTITSFPNPDLAWEKTQDYNGTLQFSILNGRINGSLGYFFNRTTNAFLDLRVSATNGVPNNIYVVNGGTLENQGVEISMNFKVLDNLGNGGKRRFMWRFDPQLGQVFNKLINSNWNSRNVLVDAASFNYQNFLDGSVPINGKSVNTFYSYRFKALDANKGFPIFYGLEPENKSELVEKYNKLSKGDVYSAIMVESGRREPVLQGSINNSFVYGNWTLNVSMSYSVGNKIRLLQIASGNYGTFRPSSQQNLRNEFTQRWRYPGDEQFTNIPAIQGLRNQISYDELAWWLDGDPMVTQPAIDYYQMYDFSDLRVVKGDYLKMQYVSLGYQLPNEMCRKLNCKGATVQLSGTNLFTLANRALRGQDPSQSGSASNINLSIRPVYSLNFNLSF